MEKRTLMDIFIIVISVILLAFTEFLLIIAKRQSDEFLLKYSSLITSISRLEIVLAVLAIIYIAMVILRKII